MDLGDWEAAYQKAVAFVGSMTNEQKVTVITGGSVDALNWTVLTQLDASQNPMGYNYVTSFSLSSALASTFDKDLMATQFGATGAEFYGKGINVANAPTNSPMGRVPWSGRVIETLGVDSYLNGIAMGIGAKAITAAGVISGGKHFLLYEQETNRMAQGTSDVAPYSSNADDKTIHETYLWAWYDGVYNGMGAVMCAMNEVNGSASCESDDLLMGLLKSELGFPGMVVPDGMCIPSSAILPTNTNITKLVVKPRPMDLLWGDLIWDLQHTGITLPSKLVLTMDHSLRLC